MDLVKSLDLLKSLYLVKSFGSLKMLDFVNFFECEKLLALNNSADPVNSCDYGKNHDSENKLV